MNALKAQIEQCGLSYRKEMGLYFAAFAFFVLLAVGIYFWRGNAFFVLYPLVGLLLFSYAYLTRYGRQLARQARERTSEFVRLFTYFGIYINDGFNVYHALEEVKGFASPELEKMLEKLLSDIDADKSVTPFVNFSSAFDDLSIRGVMVSVYQMVEEGIGGVYVEQFRRLFGKLADHEHRRGAEKYRSRLEGLTSLPLFGTGIAMVMLTLALAEILEGMMHGL